MIRLSALQNTAEVRDWAASKVAYRKFTEIVYVAEEHIDGKFSTTNICYRTMNPKKGRGEPSELTFVDKIFQRVGE